MCQVPAAELSSGRDGHGKAERRCLRTALWELKCHRPHTLIDPFTFCTIQIHGLEEKEFIKIFPAPQLCIKQTQFQSIR